MVTPKITFGIIVLNGEPFVRYNLKALYPFAHEIIVVEGAAPAAQGIATPDGHSRDTTLDTIKQFQVDEDPDQKVSLITAEDAGHPNGFWPGEKDEQSQAYAKRASGDYLWQVDIDEFYRPEDMSAILEMLRDNPSISTVSFKQITFWGGFAYLTDGWYLRSGAAIYHRLFKWGKGYRYETHRPPTVVDAKGQNLRQLRPVGGYAMARRGIVLYHYSLLFPSQVREKCEYYGTADWARRPGAQQWADEAFQKLRRPFRVHNVYSHISWLERFEGQHPPQIEALREDIRLGRLPIEMRDTSDVEALLSSKRYALQRGVLKLLSGPYRWSVVMRSRARPWIKFVKRGGRKIRKSLKRLLGYRGWRFP